MRVGYNRNFGRFLQLRPYLPDNTGSRSISKVKLVRALLILWLQTTWEHRGAVVFARSRYTLDAFLSCCIVPSTLFLHIIPAIGS